MTTRSEHVHQALRAELLAGAFPYGEPLAEEQLAERFQTSRQHILDREVGHILRHD